MNKEQAKNILQNHQSTILKYLYQGDFGDDAMQAVNFLLKQTGNPTYWFDTLKNVAVFRLWRVVYEE